VNGKREARNGLKKEQRMVSVSSVALSGLFANEKRIAVAADNIANANTSGFEAKDLALSSNAGGGVSARVVKQNPATVPVANNEGGVDQLPNVSLEKQLVDVNIATYSAQANLKVLKAQDQLNKYLLDIQA
jgi:flagellar basal body rod protein FlgC